MYRRQVLLSAAAALTGVSGCNEIQLENGINTPTEGSSETPTFSGTPTASDTPTASPSETTTSTETSTSSPDRSDWETPASSFRQEWIFDRDRDWTEQHRLTEYPNTDDAYNWRPDYVRTAEYAHTPSQEEFASAVGNKDAPALSCAVVSKWPLPEEFDKKTPVDFVHLGRKWFATKFDKCSIDIEGPKWVEPFQSELKSGTTVGDDDHDAEGDTGQLQPALQATIDNESVTIEQISYDAEGVLFGLIGSERQVGYLAGGGWPATNTVTLHTVENGPVEVKSKVSGKSWELEEELKAVLGDIDSPE